MKKIIAFVLFTMIALTPVFPAYAQVSETPVPTLEEQIRDIQSQLIVLYTTLIAQLQAQIDELNSKQTVIEQKQKTIETDYVKKTSENTQTQNKETPEPEVPIFRVAGSRSIMEGDTYKVIVLLSAKNAPMYVDSFDGATDFFTEAKQENGRYKIEDGVQMSFVFTSDTPITITAVHYSTSSTGETNTKSI